MLQQWECQQWRQGKANFSQFPGAQCCFYSWICANEGGFWGSNHQDFSPFPPCHIKGKEESHRSVYLQCHPYGKGRSGLWEGMRVFHCLLAQSMHHTSTISSASQPDTHSSSALSQRIQCLAEKQRKNVRKERPSSLRLKHAAICSSSQQCFVESD